MLSTQELTEFVRINLLKSAVDLPGIIVACSVCRSIKNCNMPLHMELIHKVVNESSNFVHHIICKITLHFYTFHPSWLKYVKINYFPMSENQAWNSLDFATTNCGPTAWQCVSNSCIFPHTWTKTCDYVKSQETIIIYKISFFWLKISPLNDKQCNNYHS